MGVERINKNIKIKIKKVELLIARSSTVLNSGMGMVTIVTSWSCEGGST